MTLLEKYNQLLEDKAILELRKKAFEFDLMSKEFKNGNTLIKVISIDWFDEYVILEFDGEIRHILYLDEFMHNIGEWEI